MVFPTLRGIDFSVTPAPSYAKWVGAVVLVILLVGLFLFKYPDFQRARLQAMQRNAWACMRALSAAEQDFREYDRDGNGVQDFWTGDVAGLLKFGKIPKELAEADASPLHPLVSKPIPYKGYLFRALVLDRSQTPPEAYGQETDKVSSKVHHRTKFGFIAFPVDSPEKGYFYILNENNTIFPSAHTSRIPSDWPTDDELKHYYNKLGG